MKSYSVLLLYPDYMTDNFGQETYYTFVTAPDADAAIAAAQQEAVQVNTGEGEEPDAEATADFLPLLVLEGHHNEALWG